MRYYVKGLAFFMALSGTRFSLAANLRKSDGSIIETNPAGDNHVSFLPKIDLTILQSQLNSLDQCNDNDIYLSHMTQTTNHLMEFAKGEKEEKPTLVWIGCSLDRYQITAVCDFFGGTTQKYFPEGSYGARAASIVCHSPYITMGYIQIFGMHHRCNDEQANLVDPRQFDTEAERIRATLPDLIVKMGSKPTHVQVGSNLWDLSPGCNNEVGITSAYTDVYIRGIHDIHNAIVDLIPGVHISWRTGMPIHTSYDAKARGRKLVNQEALNQIVQEEVFASSSTNSDDGQESIGAFLNHWSVVRMAPTDCCMLRDGRHYPKCSSFAFFNNWMNQIYTPEGGLVSRK